MNYLRLNNLVAVPFFFLAVIALAGLGGCAQPKVPQEHYYRLGVIAEPAEAGKILLEGSLLVEPFIGNGLTAERPILYSSADNPVEVRQYHYHYWIDAPPLMIFDKSVEYFRGRGISQNIITPEMRVLPDFSIGGRIKRLERVVSANSSMAVIELEMSLVDAREGKVILTKTYVAQSPAGDDMVSVVSAFNQALEDILGRFVADLEAR